MATDQKLKIVTINWSKYGHEKAYSNSETEHYLNHAPNTKTVNYLNQKYFRQIITLSSDKENSNDKEKEECSLHFEDDMRSSEDSIQHTKELMNYR